MIQQSGDVYITLSEDDSLVNEECMCSWHLSKCQDAITKIKRDYGNPPQGSQLMSGIFNMIGGGVFAGVHLEFDDSNKDHVEYLEKIEGFWIRELFLSLKKERIPYGR
jgi:hypothetical protein